MTSIVIALIEHFQRLSDCIIGTIICTYRGGNSLSSSPLWTALLIITLGLGIAVVSKNPDKYDH